MWDYGWKQLIQYFFEGLEAFTSFFSYLKFPVVMYRDINYTNCVNAQTFMGLTVGGQQLS